MTDNEVQTNEEEKSEKAYNTYVDVYMGDRDDRTVASIKFEGKSFFSLKDVIAVALGTNSKNIVINEVHEKWSEDRWYGDRITEVSYHIFGSKVVLVAELRSRCNNY